MQFPVPQFTDVEDKIIGVLTFKQFGILFAGGIFVFLGFSTTKSISVAVVCFVLFGIPALGLAFGKINGRPMYNSLKYFSRFVTSPKIFVFHKEASRLNDQNKLKNAEMKSETPAEEMQPAAASERLKQVQADLARQEAEEREILSGLR